MYEVSEMVTPSTPSGSFEVDAPQANSVGALSTGVPPPDQQMHRSDSDRNNWSNLGLFSIGAVAAIGLSLILIGFYLTEEPSLPLILAGIIVLDIALLAWVVVALVMIAGLIRGIVISRGKKWRGPQWL